FYSATIKKPGGNGWRNDRSGTFGGNGQTAASLDGVSFSEGDLLLQALNGFVMVVTGEGYVFYASPTIQDYLGFHQSDVVHQSVFELIHTDDRAMFRRQLHFALNPIDDGDGSEALQSSSDITRDMVNYNPQHIPPENSSFLERSFCCRFRCLLDNSSGFLALNFHGRLKYLHGQNKLADDGTLVHPQLALFVIATPLQPPSILEIRSKTLLFQTKHKMDFTPIGVDTRGKVVLGYTEIELCMRGSGYQFIHAADMMYCADNHIRMIKTGESGLTVFRLLTKAGIWIWVQANARLVYKGGRPDFIIARQRALTNDEGEEHLRQRKLQLPFNCTTGEGVLYEVGPTLDMNEIQNQSKGQKISKPQSLDPNCLLGSMLKQDPSIYNQNNDPNSQFTLDKAFGDSHALLNVPGNTWQPLTPNPGSGIKEEAVVKDMIETLQDIIEAGNMCSNLQDLDVDRIEWKDWENTLHKVNYNNLELDELFTNDIFSYVEDVLFKENSIPLPERLKEPGSFDGFLSEVELQNNQEFNCPAEMPSIQGGFDAMKVDSRSPGRGMVKLSHIGPQVVPGEAFVNSFGVPQTQKVTNSSGSMFSPSLAMPQGPQPNDIKPSLQSAIQDNRVNSYGQKNLQNGIQPLHNPMPLPLQSSLMQGTQPMAFQNQQPLTSQNLQWIANSNNMADTLMNSCANNVSSALDAHQMTNIQGQFSINTPNTANPVLPGWQQSHPQIPNSFSSGHHAGVMGQATNFKGSQLKQIMAQTNAQGFLSGFLPQTSGVYPQQGDINNGHHPPTNSCMFTNTQPPVSGMKYGLADPKSMMPSYQGAKAQATQSPKQASCYFQRHPTEKIAGSSVIPQEDTNISPIGCQGPLGLNPDNVLPQQYLPCNGQTQIANRPLEETGTFHFPPLTNGTAYYSENNQNCCDF
ncbi:hypothetical protein DNTS_021676, partial [Danionella cerebrum]